MKSLKGASSASEMHVNCVDSMVSIDSWRFPRRRCRQLILKTPESAKLPNNELHLGGKSPVVVQSMNNTDTRDISGTLAQIAALKQLGCQLTRLAVPDLEAAEALDTIVAKSLLPLVADIHFDWKLAMRAIEAGVSKIRINPGNMRDQEGLKAIARASRERGVVIRVGMNSGSIAPKVMEAYGGDRVKALVASCMDARELMHSVGAYDLVLSVKSSNPRETIEAYRLLSEICDDPLHLGVTEAGTEFSGAIRSAVGIGTLLAEGIGDTIRVSLTGDPLAEIPVALNILRALDLRQGPRLISCPTCGRTEVDMIPIAHEVEEALCGWTEPITVAVMGCPVNGPGEARHADYGLAGGREDFLLFKKGKVVDRVSPEEAVVRLMALIKDDRTSFTTC